MGFTVFQFEQREFLKLPESFQQHRRKQCQTKIKRKYYLVQFEKIYKAVADDQEFINMAHDLVEANVNWEMAHCPFQLSKRKL